MTRVVGRPGRALDVYEAALRSGTDLLVQQAGGGHVPLNVGKFLAAADDADLSLLQLCDGPVIDIGCGPGRMVAALAARDQDALGIDVAAEAVRHTRARGARALRRDVFGPLPDEGAWGTVLLIDGNIGIGGDPRRLLRRVAQLLRPAGRVVVELDSDPLEDRRRRLVFLDPTLRRVSEPFWWSSTGEGPLRTMAADAGLEVTSTLCAGGRVFALLTRD